MIYSSLRVVRAGDVQIKTKTFALVNAHHDVVRILVTYIDCYFD